MRVLLVQGSGGNAASAWASVQPLAARFTLVAPNRGGYPPNPPLERIDFEKQAEELAPLLEDGSHLVGHSYGGVIALLMAARRFEAVHSLVISEPPAFALARGDPEVEAVVGRLDRHLGTGRESFGSSSSAFSPRSAARPRCPESCLLSWSRSSGRRWRSARPGRRRSRSRRSPRRPSRSS